MPRFLVNLTDEQLAGLRQLAQGAPLVSQFIRTAVDDFLRKQEPCGIVLGSGIVSGQLFVLRVG